MRRARKMPPPLLPPSSPPPPDGARRRALCRNGADAVASSAARFSLGAHAFASRLAVCWCMCASEDLRLEASLIDAAATFRQLERTMLLRLLAGWGALLCLTAIVAAEPRGPLTDHFQNWLISNGYENDAFERPDIGGHGSFGGKLSASERVSECRLVNRLIHLTCRFVESLSSSSTALAMQQ